MTDDLYAVLGVPPTASARDLKRAYRRRARELHPDRNHAPDAAERFKALGAAYAVLGDPARRAAYDLQGTTAPRVDRRGRKAPMRAVWRQAAAAPDEVYPDEVSSPGEHRYHAAQWPDGPRTEFGRGYPEEGRDPSVAGPLRDDYASAGGDVDLRDWRGGR